MSAFDRMNDSNRQGWNGQQWGQAYNNWQPAMQLNSNIMYVTSAEEALMRTNGRNLEMIYFHQDQPVFYRVKTDNDGRKAYQAFTYAAPNPDLTTPATRADLADLSKRIKALEDANKPKEEVTENAESNG